MAKKKNNLTLEEKLQNALVPKEEQPYQIPGNWVWTRLGYVSEFERGITFPSSAKKRTLDENMIPCIRTANVQEELMINDLIYVDKSYTKNNKSKCLKKNDIIMSSANSKELVGKTCFVDQVPFPMTFGGFVLTIRAKKVSSRFLFYMLRLEFLSGNFIRESTQTTNIANINTKMLSKYSFPLPPLLEQQRIVERIESLFSKLDEAKEKIQMALDSFETRKSAILYQAFSGELTKKWREENGLRLDDWNNGTLQSVCSIKITDGTHQTPKYTSEENGIPFLSAKDIVTGKIKWDKIKYITEELHEELYKRVAPQKEDLLLAKNGTTGIAAIVEDDKIFDIYVTLALLRADYKKVFYRFLYYLINSPICKEQFNSKLTGIGVPNLHLRDIRNVEIAYPSLEEQKEIVRILDTIFEKEQDTQELIDLIEKIDLMKKSILARAFRGELGTNLPEEESAIELLKSILEDQ